MNEYKHKFLIDALAIIIPIIGTIICYKFVGFEIAVLYLLLYIIWLIFRFESKLKL